MVIDKNPFVLLIKSIDPANIWKTRGKRPLETACRQKSKGGRLAGKKKKGNDSRERALLCVNASLEKKAKDLIIINVSGVSAFADYFILCSGTSDRQVRAVASSIQESLKTAGILPLGVEGEDAGRWILLDYDDVIIHVFLESVRTFYDLERLWSGTTRMAVPDETISLKALAEGM
jgi:ribosome-associated protein